MKDLTNLMILAKHFIKICAYATMSNISSIGNIAPPRPIPFQCFFVICFALFLASENNHFDSPFNMNVFFTSS